MPAKGFLPGKRSRQRQPQKRSECGIFCQMEERCRLQNKGQEQSPYHEVQTGAMPHATEQKNDHGIQTFPEGTVPAATKRDINIVLQEAAKGNMPPSPEF